MKFFGFPSPALKETDASAAGAVSWSAAESEHGTVLPLGGAGPAEIHRSGLDAGPSGLAALPLLSRSRAWPHPPGKNARPGSDERSVTRMKDAQDLSERLARSRRPGDEFSQGGWHHTTVAAPPRPSTFLVLLPFFVLAFLILASTLGLLYATGRI